MSSVRAVAGLIFWSVIGVLVVLFFYQGGLMS